MWMICQGDEFGAICASRFLLLSLGLFCRSAIKSVVYCSLCARINTW